MVHLSEIERLLEGTGPFKNRLHAVAAAIGEALDVQRVAIYGVSAPDDSTVRVRGEWAASGQQVLGERVEAIPLLTGAPPDDGLVTARPRGEWCPQNCDVTHASCVLRNACSTILQPLRLGERRYGMLAVHNHTGSTWDEHRRALVRQAALVIALHIAREHQVQLESQLDAQRTGIATTALHQLATPVTILTGALERLEHDGQADPELLGLALAECDRLRRLCDDLAALGRTASDGTDGDICEPVPTIARAVAAARRSDPSANIATTIVGVLPPVRCCPDQLQRALTAVLGNAARYAAGPAHIDLSAWCLNDRVVIRVRDDGPGMTAPQAHLLGEPFVRLDPDMRTDPGGTGLSLAIARRMARRGGGDLLVEPNSDGSGAQVTLILATAHAIF